MRISDWSSDVCSSDLDHPERHPLPQGQQAGGAGRRIADGDPELRVTTADRHRSPRTRTRPRAAGTTRRTSTGPAARSEEHTSELQSLMRISYAVFCLKKKTTRHANTMLYDNTMDYNAPYIIYVHTNNSILLTYR